MTSRLFAAQRIVVLGLGLHGGGLAVARWLAKQGAKLVVTDLKSRRELAPSLKKLKGLKIRFVLGSHPLSLLKNCDLVIQNPGVSRNHPFILAAKRRGVPVANEASLFLKLCPTKNIVAVTGTRGKSTSVSLLGEMLKQFQANTFVAGNIRDTVMFDVLDKLNSKSIIVLELSSWQLEIVGQYKLRIPSAAITNVLPDHLNRYPSFASYTNAKAMIFAGQQKGDNLVLNWDNKVTRKLSSKARSQVYWFSLAKRVPRGCFVRGKKIYWRDQNKDVLLFSRSDLKILGEHNLANILAAATVAMIMKVSPRQIKLAVKKFTGLHDRLEFVRKVDGVAYYNDTTATSPDATISALRAFNKQPIILIAGGTDKKLPYEHLAKLIKQRVKSLILLPGTATVKLQAELKNYSRILLARNMVEAVKFAKHLAPAKSIVLLSPAAASFGLFRHEFERGEAFKKAVYKLKD